MHEVLPTPKISRKLPLCKMQAFCGPALILDPLCPRPDVGQLNTNPTGFPASQLHYSAFSYRLHYHSSSPHQKSNKIIDHAIISPADTIPWLHHFYRGPKLSFPNDNHSSQRFCCLCSCARNSRFSCTLRSMPQLILPEGKTTHPQ